MSQPPHQLTGPCQGNGCWMPHITQCHLFESKHLLRRSFHSQGHEWRRTDWCLQEQRHIRKCLRKASTTAQQRLHLLAGPIAGRRGRQVVGREEIGNEVEAPGPQLVGSLHLTCVNGRYGLCRGFHRHTRLQRPRGTLQKWHTLVLLSREAVPVIAGCTNSLVESFRCSEGHCKAAEDSRQCSRHLVLRCNLELTPQIASLSSFLSVSRFSALTSA